MKINVGRYAEDPACVEPDGLRDKLMADLMPQVAKMKLQRNRCLVATYIKSARTKGGIIIPGSTQEEDRWQGKVGLLLAVGPSAFNYEEVTNAVENAISIAENNAPEDADLTDDFFEQITRNTLRELGVPAIGEWVAYRTSESYEIGIPVAGEHELASCRFIIDDAIITSVTDPSIIY